MTHLHSPGTNRDKVKCSNIIDQKLLSEQGLSPVPPSMHNKASQLDKLLRKYSMNKKAIILNQIFNKKL